MAGRSSYTRSRSYGRGYYKEESGRSRSSSHEPARRYSRGTGSARGTAYNYGTEAPKLYPEAPARRRTGTPSRNTTARRRIRSEEEIRRDREAALRNRERQASMNPALITFMVTIVVIMCIFLARYISLQAEVSSAISEVASLESSLSELKASNDEAYNEIEASISLEEIKYRAITELGMSYAKDDQIISYSNDDSDYVHQVTEVGK